MKKENKQNKNKKMTKYKAIAGVGAAASIPAAIIQSASVDGNSETIAQAQLNKQQSQEIVKAKEAIKTKDGIKIQAGNAGSISEQIQKAIKEAQAKQAKGVKQQAKPQVKHEVKHSSEIYHVGHVSHQNIQTPMHRATTPTFTTTQTNWFNGLPTSISITGNPVVTSITLGSIKTWIATRGPIPASTPFTIDTTVSGYTAAIAGGATSKTVTLKLGTLTKTITFRFSQSNDQAAAAAAAARLHQQTTQWWNTVDTTTVQSNLGGTNAPRTISLNSIKSAIQSNDLAKVSAATLTVSGATVQHGVISLGKTTTSLQFTLEANANDPANPSAKLTKQFTLSWTKTLEQQETETWFNGLVYSGIQGSVGGQVAPATVSTHAIISSITSSSPTLLTASTITATGFTASGGVFHLNGDTKSVQFTISADAKDQAHPGRKLTHNFTVTWNKSFNENVMSQWASNLATQKSLSTTTPGTLTKSQIVSWMNAAAPTLGAGTTPGAITYTINGHPLTSSYTPAKDEKTFNIVATYFNNGVSGSTSSHNFTLNYAKTQNEEAAETWFNAISNPAPITTAPAHTGPITASDVIGWLGSSATPPSSIPGAVQLQISNPPIINDSTHTLSVVINYPTDGLSGPRTLTKAIQVTFNKTRQQDATTAWWNAMTPHVSSAQTSLSGVNAPATISAGQIITALSLPRSNPNTTSMWITLKNQSSRITGTYNIPGNAHSVTFTLHSLTHDPLQPSNDERTQDVTFTWTNSFDEHAVSQWASSFTSSHNEIVTTPLSISKNQILAWMSAQHFPTLGTGSTFSAPTMTIAGVGPAVSMGSSYRPQATDKAFTITMTYFKNGVSGATSSHNFTLKYDKTQNEQKALDWFNAITTSITKHTAPPTTAITENMVRGWISSTAPTTSANIEFDGSAPTFSDVDHLKIFKVKYPVNGVDDSGGWLPSKTITVSFDKTQKEETTQRWFNSLNWSSSSLNATNAPTTVTLAQVKTALGINSGDPEFGNVKMYVSGTTNAITTFNLTGTTTTVTFDVEVPNYAVTPGTYKRTFTISWTNSLNTQATTAWEAALKTTKTATAPTFNGNTHPPQTISLSDLQQWIGLSATPTPTLKPGSTPGPVVIRKVGSSAPITSSSPYTPNSTESTINFEVTYFRNGVSGPTATHRFAITYNESQTSYFGNLIGPVLVDASNIANGGVSSTYTPSTGTFGILTSKIDTSGLPKTLAELKAIPGGAFAISTAGVSYDIVSATNVEKVRGDGFKSRTEVVVRFKYLGLHLDKTIHIDYQKADIAPLVSSSAITAKLNAITDVATTNTSNAKLTIPTATIDYFKAHKLTLTLHLDSSHDIDVTGLTYPSGQPAVEVTVPSSVLHNNASLNHITTTVTIGFDNTIFSDPSSTTTNINSAYSKVQSWDVFIDTSTAKLWDATNPSSALVELSGTDTDTWHLTDHNNPSSTFYNVEVRWVPVSGTPTAWTAISSFAPQPLWAEDIASANMGALLGSVEAKLVPVTTTLTGGKHYVLSADRATQSPSAILNSLTKDIDSPVVSTQNNGIMAWIFNQIDSVIKAEVDTHAIAWSTVENNIKATLAQYHIDNIEYSLDNSTWTTTIPSDIQYIEADRHLWIKVTPATGYTIKGVKTFDLVASNSTNFDLLKGWIDKTKLTAGTNPTTISTKTITGTTDAATISLDNLRTGLIYEYSVDGVTWTTKSAFINNIKNIFTVKANYQYRVVVSDPTKYVLSGPVVGNFDVSNLKTYIDVSSQISDVQTISQSGQFGAGENVKLTLPDSLTADKLAQLRVKLQYKIENAASGSITDWTDMPAHTDVAGKHVSTIATGVIPKTAYPTLSFRLVPYLQDTTTMPTTAPSRSVESGTQRNDTWYETQFTSVLSDKATLAAYHPTLRLPTIVSVGPLLGANAMFTVPSGDMHSKNFVISETQTAKQNVVAANPSITTPPNYWDYLRIIYTISDGSGSERYGMTAQVFQKWLHGDYASGSLPQVWEVQSSIGTPYSQVDMKQVTLPVSHKVPDWNELDMSSIYQRWATTTTKDQGPATKLYAASGNNTPVAVTNFSTVLKWWDATESLEVVKGVYITGNTHAYTIDETKLNNPALHGNLITNSYLNTYGLKRQFSIDGTTWSDTKPSYDALSWTTRVGRELYMRIVPINGGKPSNPYAGTTMYVYRPATSATKTAFDTHKKDTAGADYFKVYVDIDQTKLHQVVLEGTQFQLYKSGSTNEADGVDESAANSKADDYSQVEIQYLYDGNWLNKAALVAAVISNRGAADKSTITFPADFANGNVQVRWHLTGTTNTYVMSTAQPSDPIHSNPEQATATALKNFVNIWNFQGQSTQTIPSSTGLYSEPAGNSQIPDPVNTGQFILSTRDYKLTGSLNSATLELKSSSVLNPATLASMGLKIQYSTKKSPGSAVSSGDWIDGAGGTGIFTHVAINNQHKSLWIRVVSTNANQVVSSYTNGGNGTDIIAIKIDATRMKFQITTHSTALQSLDLAGNTQALTSNDATNGLAKFLDGTSTGIEYKKQVAGQASLVTITSVTEKNAWVSTNGITIRFRVTQTRQSDQVINGKTYHTGDVVEFDTFADLQAAVTSGNLNFDSSSLEVQWGILPSQRRNNDVSDSAWVKPTDAAALVNVVFTKDYLTLDKDSVTLGGNTVATTSAVVAAISSKIPTGVKLQYSEDNTNWTDTFDGRLDSPKNLWIKLAPTTALYSLKDPTHEQVVKVNADNVYTAIILTSDGTAEATNEAAWKTYLDSLQVGGHSAFADEGFTAEGKFSVYAGAAGHEAQGMPVIPNAQDATTKGHWEYTTEQTITTTTTWHNSLLDAMEEYYNSGTKAFDKDKIDHFTARYILDAAEKTLTGSKAGYKFVDASGVEILETSMQVDVDITSLTQYIYIDNKDPNILDGISSGSSLSWRELAAKPKFLPGFNPGSAPKTADYTKMEYKGQSTDSTGKSIFKFDVNPYDATDIDSRSDDNALAPRHTHFEYSTKDSSSSPWSSWSTTKPQNRVLESNSKYFKIRLVADTGYAIPDATVGIFGGVDQNWEKEYAVIIIRDTENLSAGTIDYIGFNSNPLGDARIKTDDTNGDFTQGNPLLNLLKAGAAWDDFKTTDAFILEYNIFNSGSEISWEDADGKIEPGWHSATLAPSGSVPWYGSVPVSLKNGDVVHVRLRAKNGYKISDSRSLDNQATGFVNYSAEVVFPKITSLATELHIPTGWKIYDTNYHKAFDGTTITPVAGMPTVTFGGSEAHGTITMSAGNQANFSSHITFLAQVLRPTSLNGRYFDQNMNPTNTYNILDKNGDVVQQGGRDRDVYTVSTHTWDPQIDEIADTWVDPSTINYLQVGDVLRFKMVAKTGYAFKWEDEKSTFHDELITPKTETHYAFNQGAAIGPATSNPYLDVTPLPVTQLDVLPPIKASDVHLIYSTDTAWRINSHAKIKGSEAPTPGDKWKIVYQTKIAGGANTWGTKLSTIPEDLKNGDQIKISIELLAGYEFETTYKATNTPQIVTVSGLKDKIDMTGAARPVMHFSGSQGHGTIDSIAEHMGSASRGFDATLDSNGFKSPNLPISGYQGGGIRWEYQVSHFDPAAASPSQIQLLPWTTTLPTNLQSGWFVRMRVAPVTPTDIALATDTTNFQGELYSWSGAADDGTPEHRKGWTKVNGLKVDVTKIDMDLKMNGFIGKTSVSSDFTIKDHSGDKTLEESSIIIEYSTDGTNWQQKSDGTPAWDSVFAALHNGDHIWMRAKAKTGLSFDPGSLPTGGKYTIEGTNNEYLRNTDWNNIEVTGLQKYLDVSGVVLAHPNPVDGLANYRPITGTNLVSGKVKLVDPDIQNAASTKDLSGSSTDSTGVSYDTYLGVRYTIERMNVDSGQMSAPFTTDKAPLNLKNGDRVLVEVYSKNPDYKLSNKLSASITVAGLSQIIQNPEDPQFSFVGEEGTGSVLITNGAPSGFKWEYIEHKAIDPRIPASKQMWTGHNYIQKADGTVIEVIEQPVGGNVIVKGKFDGKIYDIHHLGTGEKYVKVPDYAPTDLTNGDEIKVRLVSILDRSVAQVADPTPSDPSHTKEIESDWKVVAGLQTNIDLAGISVKIFDKQHPFKPDQDVRNHLWTYAFKIDGHQEGSAIVVIDSTIENKVGATQLLDTNGNPLPFADKLGWEFAVDKNAIIDENTVWTSTIPQGLMNDEYIHARISVRKDITESYKVKNFAPLTFKVPKLKTPEKVDSKIFEYIGIGLAAATGIGLIAWFIYYARTRKKFNYKGNPKMH